MEKYKGKARGNFVVEVLLHRLEKLIYRNNIIGSDLFLLT